MYGLSYVQLGWLQSAIDFVYERALKPIFETVSNIMSSIFNALFDHVLLPILEAALSLQIEMFKTLFMNFFYNFLYRFMRVVMMALDAVENTFRTFAGLRPVYVRNEVTGEMQRNASLIEAAFKMKSVQTALIGMIGAAFVLTFLLALFATIKSAGNMGETKNTPSRVMRLTGRAVLRLVLIPVLSLFFIVLGDAVLGSIQKAMNPNSVRMSNVIFCISTLDAVRDDTHSDAAYYNSSSRTAALAKEGAKTAQEVGDYGITDKYRRPYLVGVDSDEERDSEPLGLGNIVNDVTSFFGISDTYGKDRNRLYVVLEDFDIRRMDWFIAIGVTVVMIILFGQLAFNAVARIFDCLLLLLVQPFFAATMPLDEGKRLEQWQNTFLARLVSGYGTIVAVNIFFDVIEMVFAGKVAFFGEGTTPAVDYITKIFFVFAGVFAIQKGGPLVTGIMDTNMAARETQSYNNGEKAVMLGFKAATYPVRKLASKAFDQLLGQISGDAPGGGLGGSSNLNAQLQQLIANESMRQLAGGGDPKPGKGDAFGKPDAGGTGAKNVQFKGKGTSLTSLGGAQSVPGSTKYGGSKNQEGLVSPSATGARSRRSSGVGQSFQGKNRNQEIARPQGGLDPKDPKNFSALNALKDRDQEAQRKKEAEWKKEGIDLQNLGPLFGPDEDQQFQGNLEDFPNPVGSGSFLHAGDDTLGIDMDNPYVKIGQRDEEEREERKKYEELLQQQLDENSNASAEAGSGMDLNGDGVIEGVYDASFGSINDTDGDGLDMNDILKKDDNLDMHDILGSQNPFDAAVNGQQNNPFNNLSGQEQNNLFDQKQNEPFNQQQNNNNMFGQNLNDQFGQQNNASMADLLNQQQNNNQFGQDQNNQFGQQNNASMADLLNQQQNNNLFGQNQNNQFEQQNNPFDQGQDILTGAMSTGASINDDPLKGIYTNPFEGLNTDPFNQDNNLFGQPQDPFNQNNGLNGQPQDQFNQNNGLNGQSQEQFGQQNLYGNKNDPFNQEYDPIGINSMFLNEDDDDDL